MVTKLYPYRFELFLSTQFAILFGSLFVPNNWFDNWISPFLLILNLGTGVVLVSKKRLLYITVLVLLSLTLITSVREFFLVTSNTTYSIFKFSCYFLFYGIVSVEIIKQVANAQSIQRNVIMGLISGYISLGLLAFFMFFTIEVIEPHSFSGISNEGNANGSLTEQLMYFSFVTLLTIGYGEILPVSDLAQKGAILVALIGQFYLVILTAIVVGKYINQQSK